MITRGLWIAVLLLLVVFSPIIPGTLHESFHNFLANYGDVTITTECE